VFWTALRQWGERAVAAGILTIGDIRNGDPAACTVLPRADSPAPIAEVHWQHPVPVAPRTASGYTRQQELERLMAQAIAARWRG